MRARIAYSIACALLLVGCPEAARCPDGMHFDDANRCVPDYPDGGGQLDAGGGDDDAGPPDAGPCGVCPDEAPLCRVSDGHCVACLGDDDCGDTLRCDTEAGACVECTSHAHCPASTPICGEDDTCRGCTESSTSSECADRDPSTPACNAGLCVQCTPEAEETHCGAQACDPLALVCTGTDRGTVDTCEPCLADSECISGNRCIELSYASGGGGFYCIPVLPAGGCGTPVNRPYTVALADRTSRSGEIAAIYCGINEALTTCEAVLAALEGQGAGCTDDSACPDGGRCEPVGVDGTHRCTYSCNDLLQCPDNPALATCNTGGDRYCGRTP